jgi:hypothetical protein
MSRLEEIEKNWHSHHGCLEIADINYLFEKLHLLRLAIEKHKFDTEIYGLGKYDKELYKSLENL